MRLPTYELQTIHNKILNDIYRSVEATFDARKDEIVKQNREYYLAPFQYLIDQLPNSLIVKNTEYTLKINYTPSDDKSACLSEIWEYRWDTAIVNPGTYSRYGGYPEVASLDSRLLEKTVKLCEEIIKVREEKEKLNYFLSQTTRKYTGTLQLKKVWPEYLHKYLPSESVRQSRQFKKANIPKPIVNLSGVEMPEGIKERLLTNILEGNT